MRTFVWNFVGNFVENLAGRTSADTLRVDKVFGEVPDKGTKG
jgi:hypothetical protein